MKQIRMKLILGSISGCLVAMALVAGGFGIKAEVQGTKDKRAAIPAEHVIESITTAVANKPGNVLAVEVEDEDGKTICEVKILADDGKAYEVEVDVATNTVIEVEEDDDNDEDDNDKV